MTFGAARGLVVCLRNSMVLVVVSVAVRIEDESDIMMKGSDV